MWMNIERDFIDGLQHFLFYIYCLNATFCNIISPWRHFSNYLTFDT